MCSIAWIQPGNGSPEEELGSERRSRPSARNRIGEMHVDIFGDIRAFVFARMDSSKAKDPSHLFTTILALNPTAFKALS